MSPEPETWSFWKAARSLGVVIAVSVVLLAITGAFREDGPYDLVGYLLAPYYPVYFFVVPFFGGIHSATAFGQSVALAISVVGSNVFLWYLSWFRPRYHASSRDI